MNFEFDEKKAQEDIKTAMDKVMQAEQLWFNAIEEMKALTEEWPDVDEIIPRLNGLEGEERTMFNKVMSCRQGLDSGIIFSLRQALVRYGNLLFV